MKNMIGLIGHPVAHSKSPVMHNAIFNQMKLPFVYHAFDVKSDELGQAVSGMMALGFKGFNVTIPHKVAVMDYLDEIDEEALVIGAVNTVVSRNGKWVGYNTDGKGFVLSLKTILSKPLQDSNVLIIGAGGAARAIYTSIVKSGVRRIDLANRSIDKAEQLIALNHSHQFSDAFSIDSAADKICEYDIVINATSIGMSPDVEAIPISLHHLKRGTVVSDIIYNPFQTKWLTIAKEKGAIVQNGIGMFVEQGALAFEQWTGLKPDVDLMNEIVTKELGGTKEC